MKTLLRSCLLVAALVPLFVFGQVAPLVDITSKDLIYPTNRALLSTAEKASLTGAGDSTLHYHAADRARAAHTGTQIKSTISDFAHATDHAPGGTDALAWTTIHGRGTTAGRPAAAAGNAGYLYGNTDTSTIQRSDGTNWVDWITFGVGGGGSSTNFDTLYVGTLVLTNAIRVANGGTGATNAAGALANLGGQTLNTNLTQISGIVSGDGVLMWRSNGVWKALAAGASNSVVKWNGTALVFGADDTGNTNGFISAVASDFQVSSGTLSATNTVGTGPLVRQSAAGGGGSPAGSTGDVQINGGSGTFGAITKPSGLAYAGALLSRSNDGTLGFRSQLDGGWVFWETCLGDPTANYAAGREIWYRVVNGSGTIVQESQKAGIFGAWRSVVTSATGPDRTAMSGGDSSNHRGVPIQGWNYLLFVTRARVRNLNSEGTEEARGWYGIMDRAALSVTNEPANGVYIRHTNNVWQGVTASGSSYTVATGPSVVADDWTYIGYYVTSSTNVVFFHGLSPTNLVAFGTNTTTVPAATSGTTISTTWTKTVGTGSALTNNIDMVGLYIEP